jgi:hypothetical protein
MVAMPEKETQANQPEGSGDYDTLQDEGLPKCRSKKAQKCQLANEAEEAIAWATLADCKEVWGTTQQAEPSQEEVNRFLLYHDDTRMDLDTEVATLSIKTSKASQPTSPWSTSSEQYLQPPREEGHSSSTSSKVLKQHQSPLPVGTPKNPAPLTKGAGTFLRPGNHLADTANLLPRRETCFSKRRSSTCTSTGAKTR